MAKECIKCKDKRPNYNKPGETKALYCSGCADANMVDIKNPKCIKCKKPYILRHDNISCVESCI